MKKLASDRDLLVAQLSELLWVERRLSFDVLRDVIDGTEDGGLRKLFENHLAETREHVARVERAFRELGIEPSSAFSPGFSGLIEQHDAVASKVVEPALRDRWQAAAGIAAEHFELALYTAVEAGAPDEVWAVVADNAGEERGALDELTAWLERAQSAR